MFVIIAVLTCLTLPLTGSDAHAQYKRGRDMEASRDCEAAHEAYRYAYFADPKNTQYRIALDRITFLADQSLQLIGECVSLDLLA